MSSVGWRLLLLLLGTGVVLALAGGAVWWSRRRSRGVVEGRMIAGATVGALALLVAVADLHHAGSALNQARRHAVSAHAGLTACLDQSLNGGPVSGERTAFVRWVKRQLPRRAVYTLAPYAGPPDVWCVTLVLLPALPAGLHARAGWIVALGPAGPALQARIARHDPTVRVFAPGYVLARSAP